MLRFLNVGIEMVEGIGEWVLALKDWRWEKSQEEWEMRERAVRSSSLTLRSDNKAIGNDQREDFSHVPAHDQFIGGIAIDFIDLNTYLENGNLS